MPFSHSIIVDNELINPENNEPPKRNKEEKLEEKNIDLNIEVSEETMPNDENTEISNTSENLESSSGNIEKE